jgi:hypothetical protein
MNKNTEGSFDSKLKNTPKIERTLKTTFKPGVESIDFENSINIKTEVVNKKVEKSSRKWKQLSTDIRKERSRRKQTTMKAVSPGRKIRQLKQRISIEQQSAFSLTKRLKKVFRFFCLNPLQKAREKDRVIKSKLKNYPALYEPIFNLRKSKNFKHFLLSEAYVQSMALMK